MIQLEAESFIARVDPHAGNVAGANGGRGKGDARRGGDARDVKG